MTGTKQVESGSAGARPSTSGEPAAPRRSEGGASAERGAPRRFADLLEGRRREEGRGKGCPGEGERPAGPAAARPEPTPPAVAPPWAAVPSTGAATEAAAPLRPAAAGEAGTTVDRMLGALARDVHLATDGEGRTMVRFEVSKGELSGARIAVTTDRGTVSAVVVSPEPTVTVALEQALDAVRTSLEHRGIDVARFEVVPDRGRGGQRDEPAPDREPVAEPAARPRDRLARQPADGGIDYFV